MVHGSYTTLSVVDRSTTIVAAVAATAATMVVLLPIPDSWALYRAARRRSLDVLEGYLGTWNTLASIQRNNSLDSCMTFGGHRNVESMV